jgi:hypothetical protein
VEETTKCQQEARQKAKNLKEQVYVNISYALQFELHLSLVKEVRGFSTCGCSLLFMDVEKAQCPVCGQEQAIEDIVEHVNQCLNQFEAQPPEDPKEPAVFDYFTEEKRKEEEENERYSSR